MSAGFFAGGGATWGVKIGGFLTSGVKIGGFEGTGNIDTMGGCCFGGAGFGFLGPITAVTLISPPDKALAKSVADEVGTLWLAEMVKKMSNQVLLRCIQNLKLTLRCCSCNLFGF